MDIFDQVADKGPQSQFRVPKGAPLPATEQSQLRDKTTKKIIAQSVKGADGKLTWGPPTGQ